MFQAVKTISKHKAQFMTGRNSVENITNSNKKFVIGKGTVLNKGIKVCVILLECKHP